MNKKSSQLVVTKGYTFSLIDINECLEKPCKNGATCVNHPGTYSCNCKGGFMGRHCQIGDATDPGV